MPGRPEAREPGSDLATMLAEMDDRLQVLQQELESVALPIARRPAEPVRGVRPAPATARADRDPAQRQPQPPAADRAAPADGPSFEADILVTPPRRPARRIVASSRGASTTADAGGTVAPASAPVAPARRRGARVVDEELASRSLAETAPPEALVRQTIREAEEEARHVAETARQRIAEIGARTRSLLEHSLGEPPSEPASPASPRRRRAKTVKAARRAFEGTVVVEAGPFDDVGQLSAFEDALASIPAVADVYIRTFESNRAHFELDVTEPTALIVELQARAADTLAVVATGDNDLRLDIVRDGT